MQSTAVEVTCSHPHCLTAVGCRGYCHEQTSKAKPYPSPEDVVADVIADGRHIKDGKAMIGRATRRKAAAVTSALRAAGWRILR